MALESDVCSLVIGLAFDQCGPSFIFNFDNDHKGWIAAVYEGIGGHKDMKLMTKEEYERQSQLEPHKFRRDAFALVGNSRAAREKVVAPILEFLRANNVKVPTA
jgi:hypothetical protein